MPRRPDGEGPTPLRTLNDEERAAPRPDYSNRCPRNERAPSSLQNTEDQDPKVFGRKPQVGAAAAVDDDPYRSWTAEDIRTEHQTTLAAFSPSQARVLARISRAFRESRMANSSAKEVMEHVFEREAAERNQGRARQVSGKVVPTLNDEAAAEQATVHGVRSEGFSDIEGRSRTR